MMMMITAVIGKHADIKQRKGEKYWMRGLLIWAGILHFTDTVY
jgi:hypothetical protein